MKGREVIFTQEMQLIMRKEEFLSSKSNKSRFLKALGSYLQERGLRIVQAESDADLLIVQTAVEISRHSISVVVGDDTDLLVLLLHHGQRKNHPLFLTSEPKKGKSAKVWDIYLLQNGLGDQVCRRILFIHAILGCDTTSRLHGIGKGI